MTPFVIVADLRAGSTPLSTSLDRHPQACCHGALFRPRELPDNQLPGRDRYRATGREISRHALAAREADAWDALRQIGVLRVLYLRRRNTPF